MNGYWLRLSKEQKIKHPEFIKKIKKIKDLEKFKRFACQCRRGHVFDYRDRVQYPNDDPHFASCQGKCPVCGTNEFTFIGEGEHIYPIRETFLDQIK